MADFLSEADAHATRTALAQGGRVVDKRSERLVEPPPQAYNTATLLEDATTRLGWGAEQVMEVAQSLFVGVEWNGTRTGLITYPRTESQTLTPAAVVEAQVALGGGESATRWGAWQSTARQWLNRMSSGSSAQVRSASKAGVAPEPAPAHEAIRPTAFTRRPELLRASLTPQQNELYTLIWQRAIASQMPPAEYEVWVVEVELDA